MNAILVPCGCDANANQLHLGALPPSRTWGRVVSRVLSTLDDSMRRRIADRESAQYGKRPMRAVWLAVGFAALLLAALGVVLPLLPTTPFLLVAAFAFARSSRRWHAWLHSHPVFGAIIRDWRQHRAIGPRTKVIGVASMAGVFGISLALAVDPAILAVQAVALTGSAAFVLSRPSPPEP